MEPLIKNAKIEQFPFWKPVVFDVETPSTSDAPFYDLLWHIGSWADQFAYLGSTEIHVKVEQIDIHAVSLEENEEQNIPLWHTAVKGALYALSFFTLPLAALVIKIIFKWRLNALILSKKESPNALLAEKVIGKTRIVLATGDLLKETTDAIVNAANDHLLPGGGICGAFHAQAGEGIFKECQEILKKQKRQKIDTGLAVLTTAGDLAPRIKEIVHAVGPIFDENRDKEEGYLQEQADLLAQAYTSSLWLMTNPKPLIDFVSVEFKDDPKPVRTIGFPSISTGIYKFPLDTAAKTALKSVKTFIENNPDDLDEVRFVFFPLDKDDQKTAKYYVEALNNL